MNKYKKEEYQKALGVVRNNMDMIYDVLGDYYILDGTEESLEILQVLVDNLLIVKQSKSIEVKVPKLKIRSD